LKVSYAKIKKYVYSLSALSFIAFAIGWLRWYWALLAVMSTVVCVYLGAFKKDNEESTIDKDNEITINKLTFAMIALVAIVWVWQSGMGGFWAQSEDYPWRNAIFRDLVLRDWPVMYHKYGGALVYYIGFWLVPAIFGKIALAFGANAELAFGVASIAIYIWTVILIIILFVLIIILLKADSDNKQLFVVLGFIFFSGMDVVGTIVNMNDRYNHLEWWSDIYQYSSFTTCLFWVFNQSILPWILFASILLEKNIRNYVFLGMMCLFHGPLPFVGFFIYCVAIGLERGINAIRTGEKKQYIKDIFSVSNVLSALFIFVFIATYLLSNTAISGSGALRMQDASVDVAASIDGIDIGRIIESVCIYISFITFEFLIYMLLIARKNTKNKMFYLTAVCLMIFPFIKIGKSADFVMRASIPALFYLYYLVMQFLLSEKKCVHEKKTPNKTCYVILIIALLLGSVTPMIEFARGGLQVLDYGLDNPKEDYFYTLGADSPYGIEVESGEEFANFVSLNPKGEIFFKYFSKELK